MPGYDPNQPRDEEGKWTEVCSEMYNLEYNSNKKRGV